MPVSSSGHLVLYARLTGAESNVGFDVAVHLATLIAVIICFRKETIGIVRRPFSAKSRLLWLATLCTAASVLATKDLALEVFENPALLPVFFMITAVLLTVASLFQRKTEHDMTYLDAAIIGIAQGFVGSDYYRFGGGRTDFAVVRARCPPRDCRRVRLCADKRDRRFEIRKNSARQSRRNAVCGLPCGFVRSPYS